MGVGKVGGGRNRGITGARKSVGPALAVLTLTLSACQCAEPCKTMAQDREVCIAGGPYQMGHDRLEAPPDTPVVDTWRFPMNDWAPVHEVVLSPFFIDRFEVTFGEYAACVSAGLCQSDLGAAVPYLADLQYRDRPVWGAKQPHAVAYCLWKGKRLPTEAEWERAARGSQEYDYPWGNSAPSERLLDPYYSPLEHDVGSNDEDVSPDGVHDMFGGATEWVSDWYDPQYYAHSAKANPTGPPEAIPHPVGWSPPDWGRALRGERWNTLGGDAWPLARGSPVWFRLYEARTFNDGFRCARDDRAASTPPIGNGVWQYHELNWRPLPGKPR